jgi:OmpA-OmpF porin, OOP family
MTTGHRRLLAALTCAAIVISVFDAVADSATGAKSPEEIGRELKSRGLPLGTLPMGTASPQPSSAASPTDVQAVPLVPGPRKSRGVPPTAPQPQPTPAAQSSVTLEAITFEFGSAQLKPESIQELHNLGIALNQTVKGETQLLIEGHTDKKGTAAYNLELSKRRADAVKDYLVKEMGVSADRLETVGKGFSEPVNPRNPYAPENRRVVVVNIGAS